jgi:hypothetical protein
VTTGGEFSGKAKATKLQKNSMNPYEIYETKSIVNNWEQYTGLWVVQVDCKTDLIAFYLPGRGGRVTRRAAKFIRTLWESGTSAGEISRITGCEIAS